MNKIIDLHTHVLPGIDDGSKSVEDSEKILRMLAEQGVTDVCLTSHFYPHLKSAELFLKDRQEAFDKISHLFAPLGLTPHIGAEVKYSGTLFAREELNSLCLDNGNYLMLELPAHEMELNALISVVDRFYANFGVSVIIVHPERYSYVFKGAVLSALTDAGCLIQIDNEALENRAVAKKVMKYYQAGLIHLAASDCHDSTERRPNMDLLLNAGDFGKMMLENAEEVLFGQ